MSGIRPGMAKGPWVGTTTSTLDVTGAANVGAGTGNVFRDKTAHTLNFRTLLAGTGISIVTSGDEVTISSSMFHDIYWLNPIISFYDPTPGLPAGPALYDQYIATATANGWTVNHTYEWNTVSWVDTTPLEGMTVWDKNTNFYYGYDGAIWQQLNTILSLTANYLPKASAPNALIDSNVTDDGTDVVVRKNFNAYFGSAIVNSSLCVAPTTTNTFLSVRNNSTYGPTVQSYGSAAAGTLFSVNVADTSHVFSSDSAAFFIYSLNTLGTGRKAIYIGQKTTSVDEAVITIDTNGNTTVRRNQTASTMGYVSLNVTNAISPTITPCSVELFNDLLNYTRFVTYPSLFGSTRFTLALADCSEVGSFNTLGLFISTFNNVNNNRRPIYIGQECAGTAEAVITIDSSGYTIIKNRLMVGSATAPTVICHVFMGTAGASAATPNTGMVFETSTDGSFDLVSPDNKAPKILWRSPSTTTSYHGYINCKYNTALTTTLEIGVGAPASLSVPAFYCTNANLGQVGILTNSVASGYAVTIVNANESISATCSNLNNAAHVKLINDSNNALGTRINGTGVAGTILGVNSANAGDLYYNSLGASIALRIYSNNTAGARIPIYIGQKATTGPVDEAIITIDASGNTSIKNKIYALNLTAGGMVKATGTTGELVIGTAGTDYVAGGTGTSNYVTKFTASGTIGNSIIQDNGTRMGFGGAPDGAYKGIVYGSLKLYEAVAGYNEYWQQNTTNSGASRLIQFTDAGTPYTEIGVYNSAYVGTLFGVNLATGSRFQAYDTTLFIGSQSTTTRKPIYIGQVAVTGAVNEAVITIDVNGYTTVKNTLYVTTLAAQGMVYAGASGGLSIATAGSHYIAGGVGTGNYVARFTASGVLGNSLIYDDASKIGFNCSPSGYFDFGKNTNGLVEVYISNTTSGTAGAVGFAAAYAGGQYVRITQYSPLFTTSGLKVANSCAIYTLGNTAGLRIFTADSAPVNIGMNNAAVITIDTTGNTGFTNAINFLSIANTGGNAYDGNATIGTPTSVDVSTKSVVRIKNSDGTKFYFDLTTATSYQPILIMVEGSYECRILAKTGSSKFIRVWPNVATALQDGGHMIIWYASATGGAAWASLSCQPHAETVALTDAATIAVDASYGNVEYTVTLGGARTLGNPTTPLGDGQIIVVRVRQDGTGSRTLAYDTKYRFSTGIPSPTLSTGINKTDYLGFAYHSGDDKWDCIAFINNF